MVVWILGFALVGGLLVAFLWSTINDLLSGRVDLLQVGLAIPAAVLFYLLLKRLAGSVERWENPESREV